MVLEFDGELVGVGFVIGDADVFGRTFEFRIVLDKDAVMDHRYPSRGRPTSRRH
jgi:hypothetical protein